MPSVRLKRCHPAARLPTQSDGDVGFDLFAAEPIDIPPLGRALVRTGWMLAAEPLVSGSCVHGNLRSLLKVESRSGLALRDGVWAVAGIVDPSYRGEVGVVMFNSNAAAAYHVRQGDRIAQLVWYPVVANWADYGRHVSFDEVDDATETTRGSGGFGSSGR